MKIVFFGSSSFSIPFLEALKEDTVLVVTMPDKPQKRGKKLLPNPVKRSAIELGLPFVTVEKFDLSCKDEIEFVSPDLFVVVSFGKIIPDYILSIAQCALNLHPSELPLYRGAAPIERQIMDGVMKSAISVMVINEKLDKGGVLLKQPLEISFDDTREDVEQKIINMGIPLLKQAISMVKGGSYSAITQQGKGSYAKKITKEDELIHWEEDNVHIYNKIRALYPSPASFTFFRGKRLKLFKTDVLDLDKGAPGEIIDLLKEGFVVQCGAGALLIKEVQIEGKRRICASEFINGTRLKIGEKLG